MNDPPDEKAAPLEINWNAAQQAGAVSLHPKAERAVKELLGRLSLPPTASATARNRAGEQAAVKMSIAQQVAGTSGAKPSAEAASPALDDDPVANLFRANPVQPPPAIGNVDSEQEAGRWQSAGRSSMFDEPVVDPPAPQRASAPRARPAAAAHPPASPPAAPAAQRAKAPVAPPPPQGPPAQPKGKPASVKQERRSPAPRAEAGTEAAPESAQQAATGTARRRRISRGPSKAVLIALGGVTVLVATTAAVFLVFEPGTAPAVQNRPMPAKPIVTAQAPKAQTPAVRAPAVVPAKAAAAPVAAAAPAAAPVAAAAPAAAPAPVAAASKPVVVAEAQAAPAPAVVHAPAPTKPEATKPAAAPAAAAPIAEDEGGSAADNLVSRARKLLSSDDAAGAEALARKALGLDSTDHHAMEVLARALMDQDRGAEALPYARKIVKVRRNRVPYWLLYGDLLLMTGDEAGAKTQWNIALQLSPGDREVKHRLGL